MAGRGRRARKTFTCLAGALLSAVVALRVAHAADAPQPFREYPSFEGEDATAPMPPDWNVPGELVVGRLMYPSAGRRGFGFFGGGDWTRGGTGWTDDYPRGDRLMAAMLRRLTRMSVRSVEQPVNLDDGDQEFFPLLIAGLAFSWELTDAQAAALRNYLLHGGFIFCDSFFGDYNWVAFEASLRRVFPDRPIIAMRDDHPIFHAVYDLPHMTSVQIPNMDSLMAGGDGSLSGGRVPRWYGVEDDRGRLMMLIAFNNDVADAWQWADDARYPADKADLAVRLGVNIVTYAMSH